MAPQLLPTHSELHQDSAGVDSVYPQPELLNNDERGIALNIATLDVHIPRSNQVDSSASHGKNDSRSRR
jgi:hypothetical protein